MQESSSYANDLNVEHNSYPDMQGDAPDWDMIEQERNGPNGFKAFCAARLAEKDSRDQS